MKKILSILLVLFLLCSCTSIKPQKSGPDTEGETPPDVLIEYGGNFVTASKGAYSWEYDKGDGTFVSVEADSAHPIEFENIASFSAGTENEAKLVFDERMISYELYCWEVESDYLEKGISENLPDGKKVPSKNGVFEINTYGRIYVYELYVKYERGSCHYGFRIDSPDDWGVTLSVKNVTANGATIIFSQSGGNPTGELTTGSYYRLEYKNEEMAFAVEGDIAWTSEAYLIPKDGSMETEVNWQWLYGTLEPGNYRIVKEVMDFRGPGDFDKKEYSAEFTVGENSAYSVSNMTIVEGAKTGKLVLAGEKAGDVMTLDANKVSIYLDGEPADVSALMDGMTAEIRHDGMILETYPASFGNVYELHVNSIGTENQAGGTLFDLCGFYLKVLEDLWEVDSGLNRGAEYVSIDLSKAPGGLTEGEKSAIAWIFGNEHGVTALTFTMEELKNEGYLTAAGGSNDLYQWDNGVLMQISERTEEDDSFYSLPVIKFDAMKWRSPLGAYFFTDCSAVWPQMGKWTDYNVGAEAIS